MIDNVTMGGRRRWLAAVLCLTLAGTMAGCGKGLAPVNGKVTYKGQPVTGGTLVFSPLGAENELRPGKAAVAEIKSDGTYVLGTHSEGDGAQIGRHRVTYTPPSLVSAKSTEYRGPPSPYGGLAPTPSEVEVKSGGNTIDLELTLPPKKQGERIGGPQGGSAR